MILRKSTTRRDAGTGFKGKNIPVGCPKSKIR